MTTTEIRTPQTRRTGAAVGAYAAGALATLAGLAYTVADQAALHGLDRHLHAMYDPVGKYGQAGPLYAYLYVVGVLGIVCFAWALRRAQAGSGRALSVTLLVLALLPVFAPVLITEYGSSVVPLSLLAGLIVGWVCGLIGTVALFRGTGKA
ncbi:hypothetical protein P0W64_09960 [Tsukamurella sp. 8F]|uniref:hypothetical protein n=1 Tax=unclassified Tsukamurella TaxID=2633480 RepID=UPI0023B8B92E|nr:MULTISPECIES: hypothetical protein [unclassified Tsukamurella]MDF0529396.1 hypothetical protein [Tsukamurella sp. 8J]MDF0587097.1 hypothetical protein [Tsukamurella sp. 8F]